MEILKVFLHPPPPLERVGIIGEVGFTITMVIFLSRGK